MDISWSNLIKRKNVNGPCVVVSTGAGFVSLGQTEAVVPTSGFDVVGGSCIPPSGSVMNNQSFFVRFTFQLYCHQYIDFIGLNICIYYL